MYKGVDKKDNMTTFTGEKMTGFMLLTPVFKQLKNMPASFTHVDNHSKLRDIRETVKSYCLLDNLKKYNKRNEIASNVFSSQFKLAESLVIGNIDAANNLTNFPFSLTIEHNDLSYSFVDINNTVGEYIHWRKIHSCGFSLVKPSYETTVGHTVFKKDQSEVFKIYYEIENFIQFITDVKKVDLVSGSCIDNKIDNELTDEFIFVRDLLCVIAVAFLTLNEGGDLLIKIGDSNTLPVVQLIYLCSISFKNVSFFYPEFLISGFKARYLICKEFKNESSGYGRKLLEINRDYSEENKLINLFNINEVEKSFIEWIVNANNNNMKRQINYYKDMVSKKDESHIIKYKTLLVMAQCSLPT